MTRRVRLVRGLMAAVLVLSLGAAAGLSTAAPAAAAASPDPTSVDFGSVVAGTTATQSIDITVDSGYALKFAQGADTAPFSFDMGTCSDNGVPFPGPGVCTVKESFSPTEIGPASDTLTVQECSSAVCVNTDIPVMGTGAPALAANPTTVNFQDVTLDHSVSRLVTITLDYGYRLTSESGADQDPWTFSLSSCAPNGHPVTGPVKCTVSESFDPTEVGPASDTISLDECNTGGDCQSIDIPVKGVGVLDLAADPTSVDFGTVPVGTSATRTVTITIDNGFTVDTSKQSGQGAPFAFSFDTCGDGGGFVGPGTCTVQETFTPTSLNQATGTILVSECPAVGSCQQVGVPVMGTGSGPAASPGDSGLTYDGQGIGTTSDPQVLTLTNSGTLPLHVGTLSPSGDYALVSDLCSGQTVDTGDSCTVGVTFTPTTAGDRTGTLTIHSDAVNGTQHVSLDGTGVVPTLLLTPTSLTFSGRPVGTTSPARTITVVNTSDVGLVLRSESVTGDFAIAPTGTCVAGQVIAAGDDCTVNVTFSPTDVDTRDGALILKSSASGSPQVVPLSGDGIASAPSFSVSPRSLSFGNEAVGVASGARSVVVANHGTGPLHFQQIGTTGDFTRSGGTCSTSTPVGPGGSCSVSVTFDPTATGARAGALTFDDDASGSPQQVALKGTGVAPAASLGTTALSFGTVRVGATSPVKTVKLTNSGNASLVVQGLATTGDFAVRGSSTCHVGTRLAARASCTIALSFSPRATGPRSGALSIQDNAPGSPHRVTLSGSGR